MEECFNVSLRSLYVLYHGTYAYDTALNRLKIRCQNATASYLASEVLVKDVCLGIRLTGSTSSVGFVCAAQVIFDTTPVESDAT